MPYVKAAGKEYLLTTEAQNVPLLGVDQLTPKKKKQQQQSQQQQVGETSTSKSQSQQHEPVQEPKSEPEEPQWSCSAVLNDSDNNSDEEEFEWSG
jgi:hypothetical protein